MDWVLMLLCVILGAVGMLVAEWYLFQKYLLSEPEVGPPEKPAGVTSPFCLPQHLLDALQQSNISKKESCLGLNLLLQFLFQELRYTQKVKLWFHRKLSLEFEELLTRTATGKLFESILVRDLHLGSHFPTIRSVEVKQVTQDPEHHRIDSLELCLDIHYSGCFQLSLDANLVLGRGAYLSVTVRELVGTARLEFTRLPYTHWSFSFYSDPLLQLEVENQFQGRPLPQITNIIINQIRKSLKRKHTLPNYKLRYKPFFTKLDPGEEEAEYGARGAQPGILEVTIVEVTRLFNATGNIYCSLAVDHTAWVEMVQSDTGTYVSLDVNIAKSPQQQLGIVFKQEFIADRYQACVLVDTVLPGSPASLTDVQAGDILLAVEGKRITTIAQAAKCIKGAGDKYTLRMERKVNSEVACDALTLDNTVESNINDSSSSCYDGLRKRNISIEQNDVLDSDSSASSPGNSCHNSPAKKLETSFPKTKSTSMPSSSSASPDHRSRNATGTTTSSFHSESPGFQILNTKEMPASQVLDFNETLKFTVGPQHRYLNISVWSTRNGQSSRSELLAHLSIPLSAVAEHCNQSRLGHYIKTYALLPSDPHLAASRNNKLSGHAGFEPCLCYGDALISFIYLTPGGKPQSPTSTASSTEKPSTVLSPNIKTADLGIDDSVNNQHDFIPTQFHRATQCGFCGRKIWLKDALQCRACALSCHKKCVTKCLLSSPCQGASGSSAGSTSSTAHRHSVGDADGLNAPADGLAEYRRSSIQPEIIMTSADENEAVVSQSKGHRRRIANLLSSVALQAYNLKRAGSAHNLAPPGSDPSQSGGHVSRSLPPSPQHSPAPSRKTSLHENVFQFSELDSGSDEDASADEDVSLALENLLQLRRPSSGAVTGMNAGGDDGSDDLLTIAKATGKELYPNLTPAQRKERINKMISKLNSAMDIESTTRMKLAKEENDTQDPAERARLDFLIGKCDEKVQALTVLMLHFCAGLQHAQDQEEQIQRNQFCDKTEEPGSKTAMQTSSSNLTATAEK